MYTSNETSTTPLFWPGYKIKPKRKFHYKEKTYLFMLMAEKGSSNGLQRKTGNLKVVARFFHSSKNLPIHCIYCFLNNEGYLSCR